MLDRRQRIVCGMGDNGSPAAVDFAARQADRLGADLHLVRVVAYPPLDYLGASNEPPGAAQAERLFEAARTRAVHSYPGLVVTHEIIDTGSIAGGLTEAADHAGMLVIEQTARGPLRRFVTGSTADGVALRSSVPIVVVPHTWSDPGGGAPAPADVVTVAVQDVEEAPELIRVAFREAAALGAEVQVLHVLWLTVDFEVAGDIQRDWIERSSADFAAVLHAVEADHPGVKAHIDIVNAAPADAIIAASDAARLLVMGRRHHDRPWGMHLGPVAHRVLLEPSCPVLLPPTEPVTSEAVVASAPDEALDVTAECGPDDVVVGVGSGEASGALAFAAAEARRRGCGVHVVHAVPVPAVDGIVLPDAWAAALADGRQAVTAAAEKLRGDAPDLPSVSAQVLEGGLVPDDLAAQAGHGALLVLQHRRLGAIRRLVTHSVTNAVSSRTNGLVVAVPDGWVAPTTTGRVVVGIADPESSDAVLDVAFLEAQRRQAPLVLAHSTWLGGNPAGLILDKSMVIEWATRARGALIATTRSRRERYADVAVSYVVEHIPPVDLLSQVSDHEDVLVVEARRHFWEVPSHLGPVTRGLLGAAACPVMLVPSAPSARP
ncbi:hypothetical protein BH09ACT12_BH09ACT12_29560 [soil metagenome]